MKVTEIAASISRTYQIEDFEPINAFASLKAEVGEGENLDEAFCKLYLEARRQVNFQVLCVSKKTTPLKGLPDGTYIVLRNGIKTIATIKTAYKGRPNEERKVFYNTYVQGDVMANGAIDITSELLNT